MEAVAIDGIETIEHQRFQSAKGAPSLIHVARAGDFVLRISIEIGAFGVAEVWSSSSLEWKEVHAIPLPSIKAEIELNEASLFETAVSILKG